MKMEEKIYPKILIIGQPFNKSSGGGITISNLFYGWPKDKLAVASNYNLSSDLDTSVCEQYYQLGYDDKLHPFPLNLFLPKIKCGVLINNKNDNTESKQGGNVIKGKYEKIYRYLSALLRFLGIYNVLYKLKITPDFKEWVTAFNPDIIYSQLSTLELIRFVSGIHELLHKPVAVHIMDDWPNVLHQPELLFSYWEKVTDREFRELLDKSSILMSICESMSEEYKIRYNKDFIPFRNPIAVDKWLPYSKTETEIQGAFKILYTGRIGKANGKAIEFMAKIVNNMNLEDNKLQLDIYTPDSNKKISTSMNKLKGVNIKNTVPHEIMPALLASYDLLFLPLDFDKVGIRYAQFSMPTKTSEYMISGTPILVYADNRTALAKYAIRDSWAYVVTDNNDIALMNALNELYSNLPLRKKLAVKARKIAVQNDDAKFIREKFRENFILKKIVTGQEWKMEEKVYPKILIIGQPFNKNSGGGITISNLFDGWPKDRLAVASNDNLTSDLDISVCEQYYQLGYNGKLHPFPLNVFLPKIKIGSLLHKNNSNTEEKQGGNTIKGKYERIYKYLSAVLKFLGIYNVLYKLKITPEFKEWLVAFNPDIIYSQLSTLELIRFVSEIHELIDKPIALHMMDDWPSVINYPGLLYLYWGKVIDKEFRQLLDKSSIFMSICESMSEEYKIRYNKEFIPFHNPIEIGNWLPYSKTDWKLKGKFTILYAGRIGRGIKKSVFEIAKAVNNFSTTNDNIVFEIQTHNFIDIKKLLRLNNHTRWVKPIEYTELPKKFSDVDLLILPEDFDSASIEFLKYSIQTKVPEYMISGTPILVYADKRTALAKYAIRDGWAYVVTSNNEMLLMQALEELYSNLSLRKELAERARKIAIKNEDAMIVRENFRKNLTLN